MGGGGNADVVVEGSGEGACTGCWSHGDWFDSIRHRDQRSTSHPLTDAEIHSSKSEES